MADHDPCDALKGTPGYEYCTRAPGSGGPSGTHSGGVTGGAADSTGNLVESLLHKIRGLITPRDAWAPKSADSGIYREFMWLGQHLAVAIFICVVVVCALTAWQGAPRLKQMGASTGWTLAAVAGMASVPGAVMLLNKALSSAFTAAFSSDENTLFVAIRTDMNKGADASNPLARLIMLAALVVLLGLALLVFMTRQVGILVFVCIAPLVLASLARGGDMDAVKTWAMRLLGLMFGPFALLVVSPFVSLVRGSLVMDAVLLLVADAVMLRMIFHGIPYFGPRLARGARSFVDASTRNPVLRTVARMAAPDFHEQETAPRHTRTVMTPGRAVRHDAGRLLGSYGLKGADRPGRLTTASLVAQARREAGDRAARTEPVRQARQQAQAAYRDTSPGGPAPAGSPGGPAPANPPASPNTP
ncbi:hypothetical protein ABZZ74_48575 [Streptomyces sp. NPDC006476]|uniref:hypothetical protein n=1 Tax=Streptomyces sp. NPDC006476 TaxID=3157175 RepID=UPI0033A56CA3